MDLDPKAPRRNLTTADAKVGTLAFKGNGNVVYQIQWVDPNDPRAVAVRKASTKKEGLNARYPVSGLTRPR